MTKISTYLFISSCLLLSSCFKEEAPNAECDIEQVFVHVDRPESVFFNATDTLKNVPSTDSTIVFSVRHGADLTALAPMFRTTNGATIVPQSGSVHDFSLSSVDYTVTSEDGMWHRTYKVSFVPFVSSIDFGFENYELEPQGKKYYIWHNALSNGDSWANGNAGFALSMGSAKPDEYPSVPLEKGRTGAGLQLITRDTGPFGVLANKRLAAGNFFLGSFDLREALRNPLKSTHFGVPFDQHPLSFKGYYQYVPGPKFQDVNGNPVATKVDSAAIYAVFYRNHDDTGAAVTLDGSNIKTSPLIVAIAELHNIKTVETWTLFDVNFEYSAQIDKQLLENKGYSLAIVFSSSKNGDHFEGAIGSKLLIDDIQVICEK
ncbi:PCMD domain-containing protein [Hoylesella oralis]|uniref:PCMD domain-containing protein n=1 Tax=Hoylesella oralis TaxID=28134 RepID=UPI0028E764FA|nr:PCMD domain-containing protein [Hoylesella oralis]